MVRIERILCPLDLSDVSERALDQATGLARWYGATISALYVWPTVPLTISATHAPVTLTQLDPATRRGLERELERFVASARQAGVQVNTLVAAGDPTLEILRQADETNADLLVMGTRGRAGLQRWVLGSVTEGVLRRAPFPVLTIAAPAQARASPADLGTILCAIDFSEASLRALEYGFSLAQEKRARLVLLQVVAGFEGRAEEALFLSPDFAGRVAQEAEARLRALVPEGADDWCIPESCVRAGSAAREILRVAAEKGADLIVMGVARKGWFDVLFGSTIRAVERDARCPVLAVPAPGRHGARRAERRDRQEERRAI
jgi:nucleotide-binding universal stress UspA family protein